MSRKSRNTHDVLCVSHQIATKSLKLFTVFGGVRSAQPGTLYEIKLKSNVYKCICVGRGES